MTSNSFIKLLEQNIRSKKMPFLNFQNDFSQCAQQTNRKLRLFTYFSLARSHVKNISIERTKTENEMCFKRKHTFSVFSTALTRKQQQIPPDTIHFPYVFFSFFLHIFVNRHGSYTKYMVHIFVDAVVLPWLYRIHTT